MVNASLNWASIVGIVLAVGGALLYFMRTFKPALARDYDVFFAAIGLLCGGILFFQGWRLDPILQFGQFLLAGTTVFFAYESVRLRGVATEQARRSAYFEDEPAPARVPYGGSRGGLDDDYDRFDEPEPIRRRFTGRGEDFDDSPREDFYRPRRNTSRAAIPEQAASRRSAGRDDASGDWDQDEDRARRMARFRAGEERSSKAADFGERRTQREDQRRGSRPSTTRGPADRQPNRESKSGPEPTRATPRPQPAEDAAFTPRRPSSADVQPSGTPAANPSASPSSRSAGRPISNPRTTSASNRPTPRSSRPRDNSSRFDD